MLKWKMLQLAIKDINFRAYRYVDGFRTALPKKHNDIIYNNLFKNYHERLQFTFKIENIRKIL